MRIILEKITVTNLIAMAKEIPPTAYSANARDLLLKWAEERGLQMSEETKAELNAFAQSCKGE